MEQGIAIKAGLFISHFEAIKQIPDPAEQAAMYEAIFNYQFYGTMPEGLPPIANMLMTAIFPVLEKDVSYKSGGGLGNVSAETVALKVKELGGKKAAAAFFGVTERTIYNKLAKTEKAGSETSNEVQCNFSEISTQKEEGRKKNEEERRERKDAQSAKAEAQAERTVEQKLLALPLSSNSVLYPAEQIPVKPPPEQEEPFCPPTEAEVAAYCAERKNGIDPELFVAYYAATGWKRKSGADVTDWKSEVVVWEKRERPAEKARASPPAAKWEAPPPIEISEEEREQGAAMLAKFLASCKAVSPKKAQAQPQPMPVAAGGAG